MQALALYIRTRDRHQTPPTQVAVASSVKTHLTSIQLKCTESLSKKEVTVTATARRPTGFGILGRELLHRVVQCTQGVTARLGVPTTSQDVPGLVMETLLGYGTLISRLWDTVLYSSKVLTIAFITKCCGVSTVLSTGNAFITEYRYCQVRLIVVDGQSLHELNTACS